MTQTNPISGNTPGMPEPKSMQYDMTILRGLIEAADALSVGMGRHPQGDALFAVIVAAKPMAQQIANQLAILSDRAAPEGKGGAA